VSTGLTDEQKAAIAKHFKPIDWSKSVLGREVWAAWNSLDHAIHNLACAQVRDVSARFAELEEAKKKMATALRARDQERKDQP
jgi:hypothetical protein